MTQTREMLEASSIDATPDVAKLAAAIDACLTCVQTCTSCADSDLLEPDLDELRTCIALNQTCADLCDLTARVLSRAGHLDHFIAYRVLQACVRACVNCADECARHAHHHRHCAICETACRACEQACSDLLGTEAFSELENPAAG